jgi:outer membrane protein W
MKVIVAAAILLLAFPLAAQTRANELGVFLSMSQFDSTNLSEDDEGIPLAAELDFDEDIGYGISYTRYWSDRLALEFAAQRLSANAEITISGPGVEETFDAGEIELTALSAVAQWHFGGAGRFDPYIGGGLAYVTGNVDVIAEDPEETEEVELENETTWVANAGVNFRITDAISIGADAKYINYEPQAEDDETGETLDVNPLVISAAVKLRF